MSTPSGPDGPGLGVALGVLQEVDDLDHLALGPLVAGDVGEAGRGPSLVVDLGLGSADAHDPARQLSPGAAPHPHEDPDEEQEAAGTTTGRRGGSRTTPPRSRVTSWAFKVGASDVSLMARGIWLV